MIVVADTGPLLYLIQIDVIHVMQPLYGQVWTTPAVIQELCLPHSPPRVQEWASSPPSWLIIETPYLERFDGQLHRGEASVLSLAYERAADLVLVDERDATRVAQDMAMNVYGTLGVVARAGARNLINFERAIANLQHGTVFHITDELIEQTREFHRDLCRERQRDRGREP